MRFEFTGRIEIVAAMSEGVQAHGYDLIVSRHIPATQLVWSANSTVRGVLQMRMLSFVCPLAHAALRPPSGRIGNPLRTGSGHRATTPSPECHHNGAFGLVMLR